MTKLTADDAPEKEKVHNQVKSASEAAVNQVESAGEAAVHMWISCQNNHSMNTVLRTNGQHADPTVNGMIVSGLLNCEMRHVGMQEQISMCIVSVSMCIASVDGKCYDRARACGGSKLI